MKLKPVPIILNRLHDVDHPVGRIILRHIYIYLIYFSEKIYLQRPQIESYHSLCGNHQHSSSIFDIREEFKCLR